MIESGYLVDTDVIINYLKGKSKSKEFLMKIIEGKAFGFFSVISEAELLSGARNAKEEANIYDHLYLRGMSKKRAQFFIQVKSSDLNRNEPLK